MQTKILLFVSIFFAFASPAFAQTGEARKIDEVEGICCEDLRTRFDQFLYKIQENRELIGYIVFYGGKSHLFCDGQRRLPKRGELSELIYAVENHIKFRGQNPTRFVWINGGYKEDWTLEFWVVPGSAEPPKPAPTVEKRDIKFQKSRRIETLCEF
ncbi:MAG TPA: hypothetical protein VEX64_11920 [Pyrinomonadaceae bacterium]|nr:hypothetical protein [Pyrinomonadaceae bacterium]